MAEIIYGDNGSASALTYHAMSNDLADFISEQNERTLERVSETARGFMSRASDLVSRISYSKIRSIRERADRALRSVYLDDDIRELKDITEIQTAKPKMRRYLMADPELRTMYRDKRLSGWDGKVEDDASVPVEETPEYKHVINGVLIGEHVTEYFDERVEELDENEYLTLTDRMDVMSSWRRAKSIINIDKLDPTSVWGATLD